jgi:hypothetical protein
MKHLLTIISCFAVLSISAQTDYPFPWNPDADLDGWVSTEDLLLLLTVFGTQFEPDTWETDSISAAVVLDGNHNYFQCQSYCNDIEGNWRMADLDAFGRHFDLASSVSAYFWVNGNDKLNSSDFAYDTYQLYGPTGNMDNVNVNNFSQAKKCMCYIQSSPFVPSQFTEDSNLALWSSVSDLQVQVDSLQTQFYEAESNGSTNDPDSSNPEQSITSQEIYFDTPQQYIFLEEATDHVVVSGNNYEENGCSGCAYSYHLVLPEVDIPDGYEILVWYSPNDGAAPDFEVFSNSGSNELMHEEGPCVGKFVWFGNRWFRI